MAKPSLKSEKTLCRLDAEWLEEEWPDLASDLQEDVTGGVTLARLRKMFLRKYGETDRTGLRSRLLSAAEHYGAKP